MDPTRGAGSESVTAVHADHLTAAQRLLKVAGIFARLYRRDGKPRYLGDLPTTLAHLRRSCRALPELAGLLALLDELELEDALARVPVSAS